MRIIFLNRFYWPEKPATGQLLTDLAEALAAQGHPVTVITSGAGSPDLPRSADHRGVNILRVRGSRCNDQTISGKASNFSTYYLAALWRLWREARRETLVIALTDPPLLGIGVTWVARLRGARIVHWVQDIYPELAMELGGQHWMRVFRPWRNRAWRRADRCVSLGTDMAGVLVAAGVPAQKITVIPNWAPSGLGPPRDSDVAAFRRECSLDGKFVVAYSGNLGRVHHLEPLLAVAAQLRSEAQIRLVFIGGGAQRAWLETEVRRLSLPNVTFLPAQPRERLAISLAAGDVHLVTVRPGCANLVFPSKLYGACAVARSTLFIGPRDCEIARLVRENGLGHAFEAGQITEIAAHIRSLAADRTALRRQESAALEFAARHDATAGAAQWISLLGTLEAC